MPTPEQKRADWSAWLLRQAEHTAIALDEQAHRVRDDAKRFAILAEENALLREALTNLLDADAGNFDTMHPDLARRKAREVLDGSALSKAER